jgi:crotonobetaine/carnitine-CoA ligase
VNVADRDVLPRTIRYWAEKTPGKCAVQHVDGRSLTYAELMQYTLGWSRVFEARRIATQGTVACLMHPSFSVIGAWLGLGWLRATFVPINTDYRGNLLRHVLVTSLAKVVLVEPALLPTVVEVLPEVPGVDTILVADDVGAGSGSDRIELGDRFVEVVRLQPADLDWRGVELPFPAGLPLPQDLAAVPFTSGTTGPSKGVAVPWRQIADMSRSISQFDSYDSSDAFYCPFPWYHASSMFAFNLMALVGGTLVIRDKFSASSFLADVRQYRCTSTMLLGAMATFLMAREPREDDADNPLTKVLLTPMVKDLDAFRDRFGVRVSTYYNMTEMSGPIVTQGFDNTDPTTCGKLSPGYEARVVDEDDEEVPDGQVGELVVRPKRPFSMMSGYWNNPAATVEAWRNLWFHTGDLFRRDARGNYFLIDRRKDSLRRRGENISSWELECEVNRFPDVAESAAVALPSVHSEDEVRIFVVAKGPGFDPAELYTFLKNRLPSFMLPAVIDLVDAFPKTPTERTQKHLLRERPVSESSWLSPAYAGSTRPRQETR